MMRYAQFDGRMNGHGGEFDGRGGRR